ncbi:O-succinylbenzoate synthase [Mycolicibacterium mageritense DSM 44476 = CIP 104973]|uniref:O-succinylbenzoate synthase n=1 Tax=Mycolicibacterium mageritense TaxID=53462 RepID=A0AAI8U070_MYCME|nr:enolase C-terminal domain-like protein [Mycolicibacterium mageritense]MCC9185390.1 O-succinylbenzoate synthase [Mycolicibacterium mageritense]CDO26101.1 O-succinylbenzoate synthase [Mycolicibacterium mageritense DSM 44476 = CIP 104973]BBX37229.1 o-succinylbenzoate synthase [Mycolicibacterium mageritense]BDY32033.1 o-succinylbenzoate synthase [Mycolicibacterium mageritense]GJJ19132.1 o-succinylbenzoate synthase [Mycolicibacterium mageritense]
MQTLIDFDTAPVFAIPLRDRAHSGAVHEGMLIEGPQGWGEFSPAPDDDAATLVRWLTAATEAGTVGWPDPVRGRIPVAVTVAAVDADRAHEIVTASKCRTAAVEVGGAADTLEADIARVEAVRDALGPGGVIRCDARGRWHSDAAVAATVALDRAAGGLEFVARPCRTIEETAGVRRRVGVRVAADAAAEGELPLGEAADVLVLSCGPLGGARRALRVAERSGLPCVVTSAPQTTIGAAAGLALAGALPELPFACELATTELLVGDVVADSRSLRPVEGRLPVAPMPPAPQPDLVARYAVADPGRVAWWRDRIRTVAASL